MQTRSEGSVATVYTYDGLGRLKRDTEPGMDLHHVQDALSIRDWQAQAQEHAKNNMLRGLTKLDTA